MNETQTATTIRAQAAKLLQDAQADLAAKETEVARNRETTAKLLVERDDLRALVRELTPRKERGKTSGGEGSE